MKYNIEKNGKKNYLVIEDKTHYIIKKYRTLSDASRMVSHLNSGGGFNGNTPGFIVNNKNIFSENRKNNG